MDKKEYHKMMCRINVRVKRNKPIMEWNFNRLKRYLENNPRRWLQELDF